jgi:hypothetical protein
MERCGKINLLNSVSESWTGIDVMTAFFVNTGMMEWPYLKIAELVC